jgi:proteasome lid subunit RPN8/RPN11
MESIGGLTLSDMLYRQVLSHARMALPKEAVGLLGGSARGEVSLVLPLPNIAEGNRSFIADPFAQFCALRRLRDESAELLAIYHSHPDGGVDPSLDDLAYARRWSCVHLIIAVSTDASSDARVRGFRYGGGGRIDVVPIRVSPVESRSD